MFDPGNPDADASGDEPEIFVLGPPAAMPQDVWEAALDAAFSGVDLDASVYPDESDNGLDTGIDHGSDDSSDDSFFATSASDGDSLGEPFWGGDTGSNPEAEDGHTF